MFQIKNKKFQRIVLVLSITTIAIFSGILSFGNENITEAQSTEKELSGYAWSSNIGWISMNCSNTGTCGTGNYGVTLNEETGNLTGHAWSSNIGWLQFGGLSGFPTGSSTQAINANISSTTDSMSGWARFLSFDDEEFLTEATSGTETISVGYRYDLFGNVFRKDVYNGNKAIAIDVTCDSNQDCNN